MLAQGESEDRVLTYSRNRGDVQGKMGCLRIGGIGGA